MLLGLNNTSGGIFNLNSTKPGAAFVTRDAGMALIDGVPGRRTRLRWMPGTDQTTADYVNITIILPAPIALNCVALLNTTLPVGTVVDIVMFNGATNLGSGGIGIVRTAKLGDGSVGAVLKPMRQPAVTEVRFLIRNNVAGVASIAASVFFDLGELVLADVVDMTHINEWGIDLVDPSTSGRTRGSRPIALSKTPYRRFESDLTAQPKAIARGGGLSNGLDWETLRRAMLAPDARTVAIARHTTLAGGVDQPEIEDTLLFGIGRMAPIVHQGGDYYGTSIAVEEVP